MSYETGAPPPPEHVPEVHGALMGDQPAVPAARPARGYDSATAVPGLMGPPRGTVTYRLRGTETAETG